MWGASPRDMEINKVRGKMGKHESMGEYDETKELEGTRHHEILVVPTNLLFEYTS